MEVKGQIHKVYETKQVSEKFKLREFIVRTDDTYPQFVKLQLTQDKCGLLDKNFTEGDFVNCFINIRGKEYKDKNGVTQYFNSIEAWKLDKLSASNNAQQPQNEEVVDDLPF